MKRTVGLLVVLAVVVAAAIGGWAAGSRIKSPEQVAAEAAPPEPSLITVPVERRAITTDVVTRGTVRFDQPETVEASVWDPTLSPVVTQIPEVGTKIVAGDVMYEIAGRPTFALTGDLPLFRDLVPGVEGEDVAQLQLALAELGFSPGPFDGIYGSETQAAVRALYKSKGYEPIGPLPEEEAAVEAARDGVEQAQAAYNAVAEQRKASDLAAAAVANAKAAEIEAAAALFAAEERLAAAVAGTHPDTGEPPTNAQLAALEAEVATAQTAADEAAIRLGEAQAQLDGFGPAPSGEAERSALDRAKRDLGDAVEALGDKLPTAEVRFFEIFPIRVDSVTVGRGDVVQGEIMQVSGSRLAIDSSVDLIEAELIEVGDVVQIDLTRLGISLPGAVSFKAEQPGTEGVTEQDVYLEIIPDEVRPELNDASVRITIPVESTAGEVLAVPVAAVSATAGGGAAVTVLGDDGSTRTVAVTTGLSAGGTVEITPVDGDLVEGDQVVVGQQ